MSVSAAIRRMLDAGLSIEQALIAAEAFEAVKQPSEPVLTSRQARNKRYYDSKKASESRLNSDDQDVSDDQDAGVAPPSDKENPPHPLKKLTTTQTSSLRSDGQPSKAKTTPRSELLVSLDADHVQAVIDHRQRLGKPLTAHAAKLLAGKFSRCQNPNAAADVMISNGWQGFEPEWMEKRSAQRQQAPPGKTAHQQRHQASIDAFDRQLGIQPDDEFTGNTIDLADRDFRSH